MESLHRIWPRRAGLRALSPTFQPLLCLFCTLLLSGCLHSLFPESPPAQFYRIDYRFRPSGCAAPFPASLRVEAFQAPAPYDTTRLIATSPSREVFFSSHYQWVAPAGDMVASDLMRDLSIGKVFENVVPAGSPIPATYRMDGQIYRFDLQKSRTCSNALLDVEISLWRQKPRVIIFRKHFHYESPPLQSNGPAEFAAAMSALVSRLSSDLRGDLCTLRQDSLHPAGG